MHYAPDYNFQEIEENAEFSHIYTINDAVYNALVSVFQDKSPIHIDEKYAKAAGFAGRVMHGAILQGVLVAFCRNVFSGEKIINPLRQSQLSSSFISGRRNSINGSCAAKGRDRTSNRIECKFCKYGIPTDFSFG